MKRKFEWDDKKAAMNVRKHGVPFEEAGTVFESMLSITVDDLTHSEDGSREKTIGISSRGRVIVVIHSRQDDGVVRIISARKANKKEVANYEEEIKERFSQ